MKSKPIIVIDHADRWRVSLDEKPPRIEKYNPLYGWHDWQPEREDTRGLRERLIARASALRI